MQFEGEALEEGVGRRPLSQLEAQSLSIGDSNRKATGDSALGSTLYTGEDEAFAFARARSRMMEMQSSRYLRLDLRQHLGTSQG